MQRLTAQGTWLCSQPAPDVTKDVRFGADWHRLQEVVSGPNCDSGWAKFVLRAGMFLSPFLVGPLVLTQKRVGFSLRKGCRRENVLNEAQIPINRATGSLAGSGWCLRQGRGTDKKSVALLHTLAEADGIFCSVPGAVCGKKTQKEGLEVGWLLCSISSAAHFQSRPERHLPGPEWVFRKGCAN